METLRRRPRPLLALALAASCAAPALAFWWGPRSSSRWAGKPPVVDGSDADWTMREEDDYGGVAFGFANDDADLYAVYSPHDKGYRRALSGQGGQAPHVWLSPSGRIERAIPAEELRVGPLDEHGVVEARIPLGALPAPRPETVMVGLETEAPEPVPATEQRAEPQSSDGAAVSRRRGGRGAGRRHGPRGARTTEPVILWIRVTLARRSR
jgi:hypothetical protein